MDSVVHFEIPAEDTKRAQDFYSKVFGWKITPMPEMDYIILGTTEVDEEQMPKKSGAINGGMMKRNDKVKNPVITINVKDVDKALGEVKEAGGEVVVEKFEVGDMGYDAYFKDTEDNVLGVWEDK